MELRSLIEYRCACGKLLFRGFMLISVVEIKCKRCGETRIFRDSTRGARSFMLVVDGGGRVADACEGVAVLECSRQYVIGKPLLDILPLVRDAHYQEIIPAEVASQSAAFSNGAYPVRGLTRPVRESERSSNANTNSKLGISTLSNGTYQIKNNTLLLHDRKLPLESHVVPVNDSLYRIFNIIKEA